MRALIRASLAGGACLAAGSAFAQLLAVTWGTRNLYNVSPVTAVPTLIGATGLESDMAGLEFHPDGRLLAVTVAGGGAPNRLFQINPFTAANALVGVTGSTFISEGALAFAPDGTGYATTGLGETSRNLLRVNASTGAAVVVGDMGAHDINGLMWRSDGVLIGIDSFSHTSRLVSINPTTAETVLGPTLPFEQGNIAGMASRPNRYSGWILSGGATVGGTNTLYSFNAFTGSVKTIGPVGLPGQGASGLAFSGPSQPDLLGVHFDTGSVYRINTSTGFPTLVGPSGVTNCGALELAPDGTLYMVTAGTAATLYRVNPATGVAALVGPLGVGFVFEGGLAIENNMTAYAVNQDSAANAKLLRINLATGQAVVVGDMGNRDINGLMIRSDGTLIGVDRIAAQLVRIDKASGASANIFALPFAVATTGGSATNAWHYGMWYGNGASTTNTLYFINCYTGGVSVVGAMGFTGAGLGGLAITPRFVSGTMTFQALDSSAPNPTAVRVDIRIPETLVHLWSKDVTVNATDTYSMTAPEVPGEYDYSIKHTHWLRRTRTIDSTLGSSSGINWFFINGDADPDNEVNLVDYATVSAAFGSTPGHPNWNPMADLDEDGEVTLVDIGIVAANFGTAGDD